MSRIPAFAADYAGLVQMTRARSTGHYVGIYDGTAAGMDTEAGRWQTVCEAHDSICSHRTLALAREHSHAPEGWCEPCGDQVEAPPAPAYDSASYRRGWAASERAGDGALDRADGRGEKDEWYDGYMDHAVGRPKYFHRDASDAEKAEWGLA